MKKFKKVLEFRRAYIALGYCKNKMTLEELFKWVKEWCEARGLRELEGDFRSLALGYVNKELGEDTIAHILEKRKQDTVRHSD